jgi:integrase
VLRLKRKQTEDFVFTKAQEWELLPDSFANPMHRVKLPRKWEVRQKRILSPEQTMRVLARLRDPVLLISQTCLETGARISEVTGLRIQHVDLQLGCVRIEQRHWRGDIDEPKTARSRRTLAPGTLVARHRDGLLIDHGSIRLLWVGKERTIQSFQGFFTLIGKELAAQIQFVCSDMWQPYLDVIRRNCSQALHI